MVAINYGRPWDRGVHVWCRWLAGAVLGEEGPDWLALTEQAAAVAFVSCEYPNPMVEVWTSTWRRAKARTRPRVRLRVHWIGTLGYAQCAHVHDEVAFGTRTRTITLVLDHAWLRNVWGRGEAVTIEHRRRTNRSGLWPRMLTLEVLASGLGREVAKPVRRRGGGCLMTHIWRPPRTGSAEGVRAGTRLDGPSVA